MVKKANIIVLIILNFYVYSGSSQTWEIKDTTINNEKFYLYHTQKKKCCWEDVESWLTNGRHETTLPKDGNWLQLFYEDNKRIAKIYQIKNGVLNGNWQEFYFNQQLETSGKYCNELKCGEWIQYYKNGVTKNISYYENGEPCKEAISYYENGKVEHKGNYQGYNKIGLWQYFHENGQLKLKQNYSNGIVIDGSVLCYHLNGKIHFKGGLKNGIPNKEWTIYYPNNKIESIGSFTIQEFNVCSGGTANISRQELKIGKWQYFYNSGKLFAEIEYKMAFKKRQKQSMSLDKRIIYSKIFKERYYDEDGEKIKKRTVKETHFYKKIITQFNTVIRH